MVFENYDKNIKRYRVLYTEHDRLLTIKEELFNKTQPKAISYNEKVKGGSYKDSFTEYLERKKELRLDERLQETESILKDREKIINQLENDLMNSKDLKDKVYYLKEVKKNRVSEILDNLQISRSTYNRIIKDIYRSLSEERAKSTK